MSGEETWTRIEKSMGPHRANKLDDALERMHRQFRVAPVVHPEPLEKFIISREIQQDFDKRPENYYHTFFDMMELGLAAPPFAAFTGVCQYDFGCDLIDYYPDGIRARTMVGPRDCRKVSVDEVVSALAVKLYVALVVLLATPNVIKDRQGRRKLKLETGDGAPRVTTILRIGKVEYEPDGMPSVLSVEPRDVRPHLRRGHIRHQPHGEGRVLRKKIFVPPCFVNGDPSFYPKRDHYEVRMAQNDRNA